MVILLLVAKTRRLSRLYISKKHIRLKAIYD
nr:MAG TPA: hypothetical protein [Caudoviricetes sp.]